MRTAKSLQARIELLERGIERAGDAEMLAWGETVTDEELQELVDFSERYIREHGWWEQHQQSELAEKERVRAMSEADILRGIKLGFAWMRAQTVEGETP